MKLTSLTIRTLPGITPGFVLDDLSQGVNLVTGPNAVGKSSLIRALRYLVGGVQRTDPPALALEAVFEDDEGRWTVRRTGQGVAWEQNGQITQRPHFVEGEQLGFYLLSMEDLLEANDKDETFARRLRQELNGGYDLKALRKNELLDVPPRIGRTEERTLQDARRALSRVQTTYEDLYRQEQTIPQLEAKAEEARSAAARARLLEQAIELLVAYRQTQQIQAELREFPSEMEHLAGNEIQQLDDLEGQCRERENELQIATVRRDQATRQLEATGLAAGRPNLADLNALSEVLQQANVKRNERNAEQNRLAEAETVLNQSLDALGRRGEQVPVLSPDTVARAENFARAYQNARAHRDNLEGQLQGETLFPDPQIIQAHREAASALREWLASESGTSGNMLYGIIAVVVGGVFTMAAALLVQAWLVLLGGAVVIAAAFWLLWLRPETGGTRAKRRFEQNKLQPPGTWERTGVEERLNELDRETSQLQNAHDRAQTYRVLRQNLALAEQQLTILEGQRAQLIDEIGFDPITTAAFDRFVHLAQNYDTARNHYEQHRTMIAHFKAEIESAIDRACTFLEHWGPVSADRTLESVQAYRNDLQTRLATAESAIGERDTAERDIERLQRELNQLSEARSRLFQNADVEPGNRVVLQQYLEILPQWRGRQNNLLEAKGRESALREPLAGHVDLLQHVENQEQDILEGELQEKQRTAAALAGINEKVTEIRTRLEDAGADFQLESALGTRNKALDELDEKYREALFAKTAQFLLDSVENEYTTQHEPEVLQEARRLFQRFTCNQYDFALSQEDTFTARENATQEYRTLENLSSATRMQLLLAVRVAWIRNIECNCKPLPFFFDEALTTSDEHRFAEVAQSLHDLATEEGRQIVYLSAREHERALWERATSAQPHHINLARVRFGRSGTNCDEYALPEPFYLPVPGNQTPEQYAAALGVPPVDPNQPPGMLHLFHLLRDNLELLFHLMNHWQVKFLGPLESLLKSNAAPNAIPDNEWRTRIAGRCTVAEVWIAAWRLGRGRAVDRSALEESGAVSGNFIDRVSELANTHEGNGTSIIEALRAGEVPRFQANRIGELEAWLNENGYIDSEDTLTREGCRQHTLKTVGDRVPPEEINLVMSWLEKSDNP